MAEYIGWKSSLTAALGKIGETLAVRQVALTSNLIYTIPEGTPSGIVHRVVFTQDGTGGHTVTYGGEPVAVDTAAGASTLVEVWPGGTLVYPGASAPAGPSSAITADDTPAAPAEGESASYFVTSAVVWPAGLVWSTDPDGGVAPTITGTALVSLLTLGGVTRAILGATFPALPDTVAPVWTATLTPGTPTDTSVVVAASALATDANAITYERTLDSTAGTPVWVAIVPSGLNFTLDSLTAGTAYANCALRAKDAAGNISTPALAVPSFTTAASADVTLPTTGMLAHFDARDLSALGEGATVATWENRIATEADLVAEGSGATYHASGGVSFVTTDGTAAGVLEAAIACAQPTTTVAVVRVSVFDTESYPPIIGSGTAIHTFTNNGGLWHISCGVMASINVRGGTSWVTLGMAANGASTRWLVDGATGTVNAGTNGRATLRIASNTSRSAYRVMDVAWVGVWDSALSATDLTAVRDYLVAEGIAP